MINLLILNAKIKLGVVVVIKSKSTDTIEYLKSIIPKTFSITNNKLANEMINDFINKGETSLAVMNIGTKNEVYTYNSLAYESDNISIIGRYEFTAYDRAIHNAVCSLYVVGNDVITPPMVYRAVNGMTETEYISPQAVEIVRNSLEKSRSLKLKVDYTEESRARGFNIDKTTIDSYLLEARGIVVEAGGHKIDAYKILATPVLYEYAKQTKQIISVPLGLLDTREAIRTTEEIIPIKEYLLRRIQIMKHDKNMSNKILYETVFEEVGITQPSKEKSFVLRTGIKAILKLWTKKNYIKDFREYKEGKNIKGVEIIYESIV